MTTTQTPEQARQWIADCELAAAIQKTRLPMEGAILIHNSRSQQIEPKTKEKFWHKVERFVMSLGQDDW